MKLPICDLLFKPCVEKPLVTIRDRNFVENPEKINIRMEDSFMMVHFTTNLHK